MMEISQDIVSCYNVNSSVSGFHVMKEFTFSGMKVRSWRSSILRSSQRIQNFIDWYHLQSHIKAMKKKAFISLLCLPIFLHLRMRVMRPKVHCFWSVIRRRIRFFNMMLHCSCKTSWTKKFLWRKQFLLSSMTAKICFIMLMKSLVDHFQSTEFNLKFKFSLAIDNLKHWRWFYFTTNS